MYREWKKIGFPKEYCIWIWKQEDQEVDQELDDWMKWGRMEEWLADRSGRKKCMTGRNVRGSWERQGITAFCTCQWIDWIKDNIGRACGMCIGGEKRVQRFCRETWKKELPGRRKHRWENATKTDKVKVWTVLLCLRKRKSRSVLWTW